MNTSEPLIQKVPSHSQTYLQDKHSTYLQTAARARLLASQATVQRQRPEPERQTCC